MVYPWLFSILAILAVAFFAIARNSARMRRELGKKPTVEKIRERYPKAALIHTRIGSDSNPPSTEQREEIRDLLLEILRTGLLRARSYGWDGKSEKCALEADHLHNLPELIQRVERPLLVYYLEATLPGFISQSKNTTVFEPHWQRLRTILDDWKE